MQTESELTRLMQHALELRKLAARGMKPLLYNRKASEIEAQVAREHKASTLCGDCGGDCETILASMKRELAIRRLSEPTAGEVFRFENPGQSDEFDPD